MLFQRRKIDKIDDKIAELLNIRAKIVLEIRLVKKKLNMDVIQPEREKEILSKMKKKLGILKSSSVEAIWKEIINACRLIQN